MQAHQLWSFFIRKLLCVLKIILECFSEEDIVWLLISNYVFLAIVWNQTLFTVEVFQQHVQEAAIVLISNSTTIIAMPC